MHAFLVARVPAPDMNDDRITIKTDPNSAVAREAAADARRLILARAEWEATDIGNNMSSTLSEITTRALQGTEQERADYLASLLSSFAMLGALLGRGAAGADCDRHAEEGFSSDDEWAFVRQFMSELEERGDTF